MQNFRKYAKKIAKKAKLFPIFLLVEIQNEKKNMKENHNLEFPSKMSIVINKHVISFYHLFYVMLFSDIMLKCQFNKTFVKNCAVNFARKMHGEDLKKIFASAVSSVQPANLIPESITLSGRHLTIRGDKYYLNKPCYVVGFGKAVLGMAIELENVLKENLCEGIISVPKGILEFNSKITLTNSKLRFIEGAHNNLPDEESLNAAKEIKQFVTKLGKDDLLIVLISGGGSALLPLPKPPITLSEKLSLIKQLSNGGADINELNCVRKKISELKGGGLMKFAYPAKVISLILSDVIGDPLDMIASGPTVIDNDPSDAVLNIIRKYSLYEKLPKSIKALMNDELEHVLRDNYGDVTNYVIGNNRMAAEAAKKHAQSLGYKSFILSSIINGDVGRISKIYADLTRELSILITNPTSTTNNLRYLLNKIELNDVDVENIVNDVEFYGKRICVIGAGEPTVIVTGKGKGGRNQQLALSFSLDVNKFDINSTNISFLSCGTDGIDGPTDAAGAIVSSNLINNARCQNINPSLYLDNNDSYNFFQTYENGKNLIKIGHTGTNVMDLHLLCITPIL